MSEQTLHALEEALAAHVADGYGRMIDTNCGPAHCIGYLVSGGTPQGAIGAGELALHKARSDIFNEDE